MRFLLRTCAVALAITFGSVGAATAQVAPVKNRISILLDSSGSMIMTPEIITYPETCTAVGWNGCTSTGNPSVAQEQCNACTAWVTRVSPTCASSWTTGCQTNYGICWRYLRGGSGTECNQVLGISEGVGTRGDGTELTPGCDVDGDGLANDSRMYQAKEAIQDVIATFGEVEFSLWRYAQIEGAQTCSDDASCPDTPPPNNQSVLTCETVNGTRRCALDSFGSASGQCDLLSWNGADNNFSCSQCSDASGSPERLQCEAYAVGQVRTGGTSPLTGNTAVNCALPSTTHPVMMNHGAVRTTAGACDPNGAEQLVGFPSTGFDDNYLSIYQWIDHRQPNLGTATDVEINASGATPIAASLRDMRASVLASATADRSTPCRKHQVIILTDGAETCETTTAAANAAATFQNLAFTNAAGTVVTNYDVPVYVIGFAICPGGQTNCSTAVGLNAIAAAGGTGSAILVSNQLELQLALAQIVADSIVAEKCNNADDDCDGEIDEDFPGVAVPQAIPPRVASTCSAGVGACFGSGIMRCTADGLGTECSATAGTPGTEVCNRLDDDCDGLVDDGIDCHGCVPQCNGTTVLCDYCNGIDEDCDNSIDEDFEPADCGIETGECRPGTTLCEQLVGGGATVVCDGGRGPLPEDCNGVDDNCDGILDGMSQACYTGPSGCTRVGGTWTCVGACQAGIQTCNQPTFPFWGTCGGQIVPTTEVCNGVDDDCDGQIDDGFGVGSVCNNGEMPGTLCFQEGQIVCAPDGTAVCNAPASEGGPEVCNGIDDDCDGPVDEGTLPQVGQVCADAVGTCADGVWQCTNGQLECSSPSTGSPEVCDGRDNDCDAQIDEAPLEDPELGLACPPPGMQLPVQGTCQPGGNQCVNGAIVCVGAVGPGDEVCDGLDNDCDGIRDDGATCPTAGDACFEGECVQPCGTSELRCPFGFFCDDLEAPEVSVPGAYCVPDPCVDIDCEPDEICDSSLGECHSLCEGVTCETGQECRAGFCLDCFDLPERCTDAQLCIANEANIGQCVADPCGPGTCSADQICSSGTCSSECSDGCPDGESCVAGDCQPDPCEDVRCSADRVCDPTDGQCVIDQCVGVQCPLSKTCVPTSGECITDPCLTTTCSTGTTCSIDGDGRAVCDVETNPNRDRVTAAGGGCAAGAAGAPSWLLAMALFPLWRRRPRRGQGGVR